MCVFFFFQAEDGIRYLVRSRGLGDVYKRQLLNYITRNNAKRYSALRPAAKRIRQAAPRHRTYCCLLYTSDAADERSSVDLGGRRIIKKKKQLDIDISYLMKHKRKSD